MIEWHRRPAFTPVAFRLSREARMSSTRKGARSILMTRLRVHSFSISLDGYGSGPGQSIDNPFGLGGLVLNDWRLPTQTFQQMVGGEGGETGIDDDFEQRGFAGIG